MSLLPGPADAADCRIALVLALDVSASVDMQEYELQAQGMGQALRSPEVAAILLDPSNLPVAMAAFTWSGPGDHVLVADWTLLDSAPALDAFAARIAAAPRRHTYDGRTGIGSALAYASRLFAAQPGCRRQVIDVAADGENNAGPEPRAWRQRPEFAAIGINALAIVGEQLIGQDARWLPRYLAENVIAGPGAFVEIADGYRDFETAMTRKLVRELGGQTISLLAPATGAAARN